MNNVTWVILRGGLGNQLFQFYTGLNHSLINESKLYIDVNHIHEDLNGLRHYELNNFKLPLDGSGRPHEIVGISKKENVLFRNVRHRFNKTFSSCIHPNLETINDDLPSKAPASAIFEGYFQDAKLYEYLRANPNLLPKFSRRPESEISKSQSENNCAITVRLKDYLKFPKIFGEIPLDYYLKAMHHVRDNFNIHNFDLYSDDINLAEKYLTVAPFSNFSVNSIKTNNTMDDFVNIAKYKFKIIANSSFSWWAAYLNPEAVVYYMDPWLLNPLDLQLGLESWQKISRDHPF